MIPVLSLPKSWESIDTGGLSHVKCQTGPPAASSSPQTIRRGVLDVNSKLSSHQAVGLSVAILAKQTLAANVRKRPLDLIW